MNLTQIMQVGTTPAEMRNSIMQLEAVCKTMPQVEIPCVEYFSDGCYGREVFIPAGTCLTGEIHKTEWIIVVSRGKIQVATEEGMKLIDATERPQTFISPAGAKRAGYALEDTWWTGFRATPLTNEADIRREHLVDSFDKLEDKTCG